MEMSGKLKPPTAQMEEQISYEQDAGWVPEPVTTLRR
jgi:hypothetical protein